MEINWKVRFRNPLFWAELAAAIVLPVLTCLGLRWEDMTTWAALGGVLLEAVKNPVILVSVAVSLWNAVNDPTTRGISDSDRAMTYEAPCPTRLEGAAKNESGQ